MRFLNIFLLILLIVGGINWGLIGIAEWNLVDYLELHPWAQRVIYCAIGFSAVWFIFAWKWILRPAKPKAR